MEPVFRLGIVWDECLLDICLDSGFVPSQHAAAHTLCWSREQARLVHRDIFVAGFYTNT